MLDTGLVTHGVVQPVPNASYLPEQLQRNMYVTPHGNPRPCHELPGTQLATRLACVVAAADHLTGKLTYFRHNIGDTGFTI